MIISQLRKILNACRPYNVLEYLVGYIFCIIDYYICRDIFDILYILYNRLLYMSGYIW
jgi:hypothetical protein